jgi:hypothetical protein
MEYEERYCAFVDILGFGELIKRLRSGAVGFEAIRRILERIHTPFQDSFGQSFPGSDFKSQSISDAVAVSAAPDRQGLLHVFASLSQLTCDLLAEGYFTRGAIVKGLLYQDTKTVFGEALVDAFHFERDVAKYPRIIVTRQVVDDTKAIWEKEHSEFIRQTEDGPHVLHVLMGLAQMTAIKLNRPELTDLQSRQLQQYTMISKMIKLRLEEARDTPAHFEKVQWFARYWNSTLPQEAGKGLERITGAGLDHKPAVWV